MSVKKKTVAKQLFWFLKSVLAVNYALQETAGWAISVTFVLYCIMIYLKIQLAHQNKYHVSQQKLKKEQINTPQNTQTFFNEPSYSETFRNLNEEKPNLFSKNKLTNQRSKPWEQVNTTNQKRFVNLPLLRISDFNGCVVLANNFFLKICKPKKDHWMIML